MTITASKPGASSAKPVIPQIISVDDHISEPPEMFRNQLSGADLESAPRLEQDRNGKDQWVYQGMKFPSVGLNAVVGRPFEEYGMEPTALEQLREGCYDVHEPIKDMDVNGIDLSGVADPELARSLEESAAENLKRVRRPGMEELLDTPPLDRMTQFLETKTVWHPIGI